VAFITSLDSVDVVMKQSGPKVSFSHDFLGDGHTREVTTASAAMAIIQDSVDFIDGKTSLKDGVDPALIHNVYDEEVSGGLVENVSMVISREVRPKILCTKVYGKVSIPGIFSGDEEEVFIGEILIDGGSFGI
jgi:hypothetical protein